MRIMRGLLILGSLLAVVLLVPAECLSMTILFLAAVGLLISVLRFGIKAAVIAATAVAALYLIEFIK